MVDLVTATGKRFDSDYFVEHRPSKSVYFSVIGVSEEIVRTIFTDPEETCRMEYNGKTYDDFTNLEEIAEEDKGIWKMRLIKDAINNNT